MQNLFYEVNSLDQRAVDTFHLSEEVMMENAAIGLVQYINKHLASAKTILIVCGSGNNGADGLACARLLMGSYGVSVHLPMGASSPLAQHQLKRLEKLGIIPSEIGPSYDIIIDALFGSGLNRALNSKMINTLQTMNQLDGFKLACDVPSGLYPDGTLGPDTFRADATVTMGALKRSLFSDAAKEVCGTIEIASLGLPRELYETQSRWKLLGKEDFCPPYRIHLSSHKGSFGHLALICGEKTGAAIIAGSAALRYGAGLVSLISNENVALPCELMQSHSIPSTSTAIALGMGLGLEFDDTELTALLAHDHPLVLDADIFYHPLFPSLLKRKRIVLTPHPKEFTQILRACSLAEIDVATLQNHRFTYAELFCSSFPDAVLVLKGSNVIIASGETFYLNPLGNVALAKGGSGDVLCGLVGALLAQGYSPLEAAIQGSLAHTIAAEKWAKNNYALTPLALIEEISKL